MLVMSNASYSDISSHKATKLLGSEIGSQFDIRLIVKECSVTTVTELYTIIHRGQKLI